MLGIGLSALLLTLCSSVGTQNTKTDNSYFYMDHNGGYKFAYDTGHYGISSQQSADAANEVTGQYSYYDHGKPFTIKYRAGVQGYQAEYVNVNEPSVAVAPSAGLPLDSTPTAVGAYTTSSLAGGSGISVGGSDSSASLKFVQDSLRMMQTQPMHVSYSSVHHGHVTHHGHPALTHAFGRNSLHSNEVLRRRAVYSLPGYSSQPAQSAAAQSFNFAY